MKSKRAEPDNRRHRWFADPRLQCALLARTIIYWLYGVCAIGGCGLVWIVVAHKPRTPTEWLEQLWLSGGPLALGALLILPLIILDCVRFSSRFAGPMVRFRRALNQLAAGETMNPIQVREDDFWFEFAQDLNRIAQRVEAASIDPAERLGASTDASASTPASASPRADAALEETTDFILPPAAPLNVRQPAPEAAPADTNVIGLPSESSPLPVAGSYV